MGDLKDNQRHVRMHGKEQESRTQRLTKAGDERPIDGPIQRFGDFNGAASGSSHGRHCTRDERGSRKSRGCELSFLQRLWQSLENITTHRRRCSDDHSNALHHLQSVNPDL